ncbi:MAG TPA: DNA polymerase [Mycobacterium sp.]|jgi:DNA polymerase-1|nr:DNA polymerase [Mycobacterium sp.]
MDPSPNRAPVKPAFSGTALIQNSGRDLWYTVGRDHVKDPLREMLMSRAPIAVDIEGEGLGAAALNLKTVTFGVADHAVILDPRDGMQRELIYKSLKYARELMFWNSAFDVPNLARNELFEQAWCEKVTDGLLYARLAEPDDYVKKALTDTWERYLGTGDDTDVAEEGRVVRRVMGVRTKIDMYKTIDLHMPFFLFGAALDVARTAALTPRVRQAAYDRLTAGHPYAEEGVSGQDAWTLVEREQRLNRLFLRRSVKGMRVDFEYLDSYRDENQSAIDEATIALERVGIVPTNANTLFPVLEALGAVPADHPRTKTGKLQATAAVLEAMDHPLAQSFVRRKKLVKNDEDYLAKVVELASSHGRIHPDVKLLGATTGRMSMGTPPLQQFPEPARGIVLADEGDELTSIDWSQIEPLIAANLAGEHDVVARYEDTSVKADLYLPVAEKAGIARKQAKTVLLGVLYGLGAAKLADGLGCTVEEAIEIRDSVFAAMPRVKNWVRGLRNDAEAHAKVITLSGRILPVPLSTWEGRSSIATHKGINYTVQGSAYDLLAETLIAVEDRGLGDAVYLAMHDELVISTSAAHDIRKIMETPPDRLCEFAERTPVLRTDRLDLGIRWAVA